MVSLAVLTTSDVSKSKNSSIITEAMLYQNVNLNLVSMTDGQVMLINRLFIVNIIILANDMLFVLYFRERDNKLGQWNPCSDFS